MTRAPMYSSSVSGFLNIACGMPSALLPLRDADLAEVLAPRAARAHRVRGDEGEHRVRPAGAIGPGGVAREGAEAAQHQAEGIDMVGVAADAGHDVCVAGLHRARGAAHRHHARSAAHRDVVQPARAHAQVLRQAHRRVGRQRKAGHAQAVDRVLGHARLLDQLGQHTAQEPRRTVRGEALVGHRHRHRHGHAFVAAPRHDWRFFIARVSMQFGWPGSVCASAWSVRAVPSATASAAARRRRPRSPAPCSRPAAAVRAA